MRKTFSLLGLVVAAVLGMGANQSVVGQVSPSQGNTAAPMGPLANPYMNPYVNPLLNPALTNGTTASRNDALLYMWAAQQQPGGLLGPSLRDARGGRSTNRAAEMPRSAMSPAGGASKYFQRGPSALAATRAGRSGGHQRYFGQNGR
jgi:hypothetical protein